MPCVLVVDDEEAIAEYFRIILSAEHYDVQVVTSAHQALDRFAEDPSRYDTVLLDMMLRDGSGIDLYRKFRQLRPGSGRWSSARDFRTTKASRRFAPMATTSCSSRVRAATC